jgi:site-specific DNA recombinase
MKAAIYSRKSKFTGKGESIENQIQECKDYCSRIGTTDFIIYEDEGYSGKSTDRPEFQRMMKDAKKKKFNTIICYRLDRISRNIADFSNLIEELNDLNIGFISVNEKFDTSSPLGRAMMNIAAVFAQLERETIAERIRDNMMQLARTGRWLGGKTPTGFISEQIIYTDSKGKDRRMYKLSPVQDELDQVKLLYEKYLELGGIHKLEGYCFKNSITSKNGNFYDKTALIFLLTNPVYCIADEYFYDYCSSCGMDLAMGKDMFTGQHGAMVYNKRKSTPKKNVRVKSEDQWVVAVGMHEGIIPSSIWIKVQQVYKANSEKAPREGTSKVGLLTPLLICGHCNTPLRMTYGRHKAKGEDGRHHYYKCRLKERSRGIQCSMPNLNGYDSELLVIEKLKNLALDENLLETKFKTINGAVKTTDKSKEKLLKKITDIETGIGNLTLQLAQNSSSTAAGYIIKQIEKLDGELQGYKRQLSYVKDRSDEFKTQEMDVEIFKNNLRIFMEHFDELEFEDKKKLLQNLIKEITWDGENLDIVPLL